MTEQVVSVPVEGSSAQNLSILRKVGQLYQTFQQPILSLSGLVIFFLAWEYVGTSGLVNPLFVSAPSKIFAAAVKMFAQGDIYNDL